MHGVPEGRQENSPGWSAQSARNPGDKATNYLAVPEGRRESLATTLLRANSERLQRATLNLSKFGQKTPCGATWQDAFGHIFLAKPAPAGHNTLAISPLTA